MTAPRLWAARTIARLNQIARPAGWHVFQSSEGHLYATHVNTSAEMRTLTARFGGLTAPSGRTLDAETPAEMRSKLTSEVAA